MTNKQILQRLGQVGVLQRVKKRQEEWKGRLEWMGSERCTKRAFEGVVEGRKPNFYAKQYAWHGIRYVRTTSCLGDVSLQKVFVTKVCENAQFAKIAMYVLVW